MCRKRCPGAVAGILVFFGSFFRVAVMPLLNMMFVPQSTFISSFWVKANNASAATLMLTTDMAWSQRIAISAGTYNWREFKRTFDTGNNDYADFRFVSEDVGTVWLDDISFREM